MRQILLFAAPAAVLALLLVSCGGTKDKPVPTEEDAPGKAAYHKISAEEAYEMMISQEIVVVDVRNTMAGILKTPSLCPTRASGAKCPRRCPIRRRSPARWQWYLPSCVDLGLFCCHFQHLPFVPSCSE